MSIASELTNLEGNIEDSYDAVNDMGGIVPAQRNMDNLDQAIRTIPQNTLTPLDIYPVGSIYMSVNNTDPGTLFGGTWTQIQDSFILAAGSTYAGGSTGGAATINLAHSHTVNSHNHSLPANTGSHTLTVDEMPSHHHTYANTSGSRIYDVRYGANGWGNTGSLGVGFNGGTFDATVYGGDTGGGQGHSHTIGGNTGNSTPGTNSQLSATQSILPPYLAVYVWKRTA